MKQLKFNEQEKQETIDRRKTQAVIPADIKSDRDHDSFEEMINYTPSYPYEIGETVELVAFDDKEYFEVPYVFATAIIKDINIKNSPYISLDDILSHNIPKDHTLVWVIDCEINDEEMKND